MGTVSPQVKKCRGSAEPSLRLESRFPRQLLPALLYLLHPCSHAPALGKPRERAAVHNLKDAERRQVTGSSSQGWLDEATRNRMFRWSRPTKRGEVRGARRAIRQAWTAVRSRGFACPTASSPYSLPCGQNVRLLGPARATASSPYSLPCGQNVRFLWPARATASSPYSLPCGQNVRFLWPALDGIELSQALLGMAGRRGGRFRHGRRSVL